MPVKKDSAAAVKQRLKTLEKKYDLEVLGINERIKKLQEELVIRGRERDRWEGALIGVRESLKMFNQSNPSNT